MLFSKRYVYKHWGKRLGAFAFDSLGSLLTFPFRHAPAAAEWNRIKKILAIRLDHLGDVIMARPALRSLRKLYPDAQIDLLISEDLAKLFSKAPEISTVIPVKKHWLSRTHKLGSFTKLGEIENHLKSAAYDLAIDFRGDVRHILLMHRLHIPIRIGYGITGGNFLLTKCGRYSPEVHEVKKNLHLLSLIKPSHDGEDSIPAFLDTAEERKVLLDKFQHRLLPGLKKIVIHPGAGYPSKRWPLENFKSLYESLLEDDSLQLIIIGAEADKPLFDNLNHQRLLDLRGQTALEDLPSLFNLCHLFIGNDSGPAHIAAGQGIPVISIFSGTNSAQVWHPYTTKLGLITHPVPCSPCEAQVCPLSHHDCLTKISVDDVFEKIHPFLRNLSLQ